MKKKGSPMLTNVKEVTIRKARRSTVKSATGNYDMNEADIALTVEAEDGKLDIQAVIDEVKQLVDKTINNDPVDTDPDWIKKKSSAESKYIEGTGTPI